MQFLGYGFDQTRSLIPSQPFSKQTLLPHDHLDGFSVLIRRLCCISAILRKLYTGSVVDCSKCISLVIS